MRGENAEGQSTLSLPSRFDGKIRIVEKDRESTFLDEVFVVAELKDGRRVRVDGSDKRLEMADHLYRVLRRGDELTLRFELPAHVARCWLHSTGYYIVDQRPGGRLATGTSYH
jgi:hypothetical protein